MNISTWREKFELDMQSAGYADSSRENYLSQVTMYLAYFEKLGHTHPKRIKYELIQDYILTKEQTNSKRHTHSAIKLFYKLSVHQPLKMRFIPYAKKEKKLPQPIEASEIEAMLNKCTNIKHRCIISLLYSAGLRIGEVINLKPEHIDSKGMIINIICAKGKKDRIVMLDPTVLKMLREYYTQYKPKQYLFNGETTSREWAPQYSERSINTFLKKYARMAGITRNVHAHLLRHSFATHSLEQGTDISVLQDLLGHESPKTTKIYTHVSRRFISNIKSPFSNFNQQKSV